mmetsp:Transcript_6403/g.26570  ORF Transcript_6403/g.26570 Transcript_6403/m.26570 type:complete len:285 (-) Transcript_6403:1547-2401(-)
MDALARRRARNGKRQTGFDKRGRRRRRGLVRRRRRADRRHGRRGVRRPSREHAEGVAQHRPTAVRRRGRRGVRGGAQARSQAVPRPGGPRRSTGPRILDDSRERFRGAVPHARRAPPRDERRRRRRGRGGRRRRRRRRRRVRRDRGVRSRGFGRGSSRDGLGRSAAAGHERAAMRAEATGVRGWGANDEDGDGAGDAGRVRRGLVRRRRRRGGGARGVRRAARDGRERRRRREGGGGARARDGLPHRRQPRPRLTSANAALNVRSVLCVEKYQTPTSHRVGSVW